MPTKKDVGYMPLHEKRVLNESAQKGIQTLQKGSIVTLVYKDERRMVLVVDPGYEGKLHLLDLKHVPLDKLLPLMEKIKTQKLLSNQTFYERVIHTRDIMKLEAYRTYLLDKIGGYHEITYDTGKKP